MVQRPFSTFRTEAEGIAAAQNAFFPSSLAREQRHMG